MAKHGNGILFNNEILVPRDDLCTLQLVESIPEGLIYNNSIPNLPTFEVQGGRDILGQNFSSISVITLRILKHFHKGFQLPIF